MRYKLVALDIDGTLINSSHEIPEENIRTIRELKNFGVQFVIVTGRPDPLTKEYVRQLGIESPVIGCNGATVRDVMSGELFEIEALKTQSLLEVFSFFKSKKLHPRLFSLDTVYTSNPNELDEAKNPFAIFSIRLKKHMNIVEYDDVNDLINNHVEIIKVVYATKNIESIALLQESLRKIKHIEVVRGAKNSLDIMREKVSKGNTLLKYANKLGIKKSEIIAIGDGENDLSMLNAAGFSVTLENGEECLKEMVDMVTVSNDDAGVSVALREIYGLDKLN